MLAKLPTERQTLLDAATLIEENGHCKNFRSLAGAHCVMGAMSVAHNGNPRSLVPTD